LLLVINYCLVIITKRVRWAYYNIYGLHIQKGKIREIRGKNFSNFQIRRNYISWGFSEEVFHRPKLSDKTGLVLVGLMGGTILMSHLFLAFFVKKRKKKLKRFQK
jgi:hypothetical protein